MKNLGTILGSFKLVSFLEIRQKVQALFGKFPSELLSYKLTEKEIWKHNYQDEDTSPLDP